MRARVDYHEEKSARVWHFVVYKLIYGTIRVFALELCQQQRQQQQ